ncbi:ribonuclease R [uncultured Lentibacter sp.]|uniref:ribonuclease R n=1 Tax=uncultured Lentibacter sp. TaxID=1659309 RepID=UPI00262AF3AC|nr:ribonuclease R [uncultured Lentibacter sp.]
MNKLPSKEEILTWISENPTQTAKRDIAKAFGIKGARRIDLKRIMKELEDEGHLKRRKKTYRDSDRLAPVSVLRVAEPTSDGDVMAEPLEWQGTGAAPAILMITKASDPALGTGDQILARLTQVTGEPYAYEGRLIRRIGTKPTLVLGIYRAGSDGGRIVPIDKGEQKEWTVDAGSVNGAKDGELVEGAYIGPKARMGLPKARIVNRLGDPSAPRAVSLIAIHQHGIPDRFPDAVIAEAEAMKPAGLKGREDLRALPLVTIDPPDARDHDDACYAEADTDPKNKGGHIIWVAIADVAHYVRSGSVLDREARKRGNSSYFPDRVVPMLPDRLSGDLCSLHEGVPRACLAVRMQVSAQGEKLGHSFVRGLMISPASLTYQEVQAAQDGAPNAKCAPLVDDVIAPLYRAYEALRAARAVRQPLELDLPERKIVLTEAGEVASVDYAERLDAHRMIEEFMVLANVCAAEELIARKTAQLFRVHEEPSTEKLDALREVAQASGLVLAKGQVLKTRHLNTLLKQAEGMDEAELINMSTLRSMTQAYYSPENFSHFGLALKAYSHFTSPIRRYADLIVHRALVSSHGWGEDGLTPEDEADLGETAQHISATERRSMLAERDTTDRYLASYLNKRVGEAFEGKVSGIARFGVFVKLDETGADGLVPMRELGREYFNYDAERAVLVGSETRREINLGLRVKVRLSEAAPVTGGIVLELLEIEGRAVDKGRGKPAKPARRAQNRAKIKGDKTKRKIERKRK